MRIKIFTDSVFNLIRFNNLHNFFKSMNIVRYSSLIFFLFSDLKSQTFHHDLFEYSIQDIKHDLGYDWKFLTTFGLNNYNITSRDSFNDRTFLNMGTGTQTSNTTNILSGYGSIYFKNYFYAFLRQGNKNTILNSSLNNSSGFGFKNSWVGLEITSGSEGWGAGGDLGLALSNKSNSYDYIKLNSDYGNLRVNFIFGFLESLLEKNNRYITARGIEWTNKKTLVLSFTECIIYSGYKRSIDIAYLNPMAAHLEIEWNKKQNTTLDDGSNAIWQISLDWLYKKIRFSGNLLIDDLTIDKIEKDKGKENGIGYSFRTSYSTKIMNQQFSIYYSYILVGTPTLRHANGYNNFVQKGYPLGSIYGSDFFKNQIGLNYLNNNFSSSVSFSSVNIGEESIQKRPYDSYENYIKGTFPSGMIDKEIMLDFDIKYRISKSFYVSTLLKYEIINKEKESFISVYYFFHKIF